MSCWSTKRVILAVLAISAVITLVAVPVAVSQHKKQGQASSNDGGTVQSRQFSAEDVQDGSLMQTTQSSDPPSMVPSDVPSAVPTLAPTKSPTISVNSDYPSIVPTAWGTPRPTVTQQQLAPTDVVRHARKIRKQRRRAQLAWEKQQQRKSQNQGMARRMNRRALNQQRLHRMHF